MTLADLLEMCELELPFHAGPHYTEDVHDARGRLVATARPMMAPVGSARAELIVIAVNAHQRLTEALERLLALEEDREGVDEMQIEAVRGEARAALEAAAVPTRPAR